MNPERPETGFLGLDPTERAPAIPDRPQSRPSGRNACAFSGRSSQKGPAFPLELQERTAAFLASHRVFSRAELAKALGLHRDPDSLRRLLSEQVAAGRVMRAPREVYVVARDASSARFVVQDCIIASKLRPDGVLGYHTALELHGISYTALYNTVHLISDGRSETLDLPFGLCSIVKPPRTLVEAGRTDVLTVQIERQGVPMSVTAFERTLVDVLHRADRAGGRDEVIECLKFAPYVIDDFDCRKVADYVELLGIQSVAGVVGWYLEERQSDLNVSHLTLERLQDMLPGWIPYALRSRPGHSHLNRRWRVYLPPDAIDRSFEGTDPEMEF